MSTQYPHDAKVYQVSRFYAAEHHPDHRKVIKTGLTKAEAQAHCQDPSTSHKDPIGNVVWFDGFELMPAFRKAIQ